MCGAFSSVAEKCFPTRNQYSVLSSVEGQEFARLTVKILRSLSSFPTGKDQGGNGGGGN